MRRTLLEDEDTFMQKQLHGKWHKVRHNNGTQFGETYHEEIPLLSKSRVFLLNISWFGMSVMFLVLSVEVLPSQVHALAGSQMKGQVMGAMVAGGAIVTLFCSPLVGLKSDRLASPYGKRRPLMLGGTVLLCISLFGMAFSAPDVESFRGNATCFVDLELRRCAPYVNITSLESNANATNKDETIFILNLLKQKPNSRGSLCMYSIFYLCVVACYALISVPYNGLIADKTPAAQRGFSSGVIGAMTLLGNVSGATIGVFFTSLGVVWTYAIIASLVFICVLATILSCPERATHYEKSPSIDLKTIFLAYWEPLREHDFRWVFITRFLMQQGLSTVTGFLEFWLGDMVYLPNCWQPENAIAIILLPLLLAAAIFSVIGGFLSDKLRRRKPLVIGSAVLMAICSLILSGLKGKYAFYAAVPVFLTFGVGFGAYSAVDFALVMDVLPEEKDKAKDLAVWHQALVLPQAIATPIGGIVLDTFEHYGCRIGLGYIALFIITSVYFAVSGYFVTKIRRAK
ncbi:uncharacterized protein LOC135692684 [Rhopilema esculentum]|uniref:uncharacterized protein LOC135692684 n=1 Tax=Rhopilema esculentum TaxID=499914 RepID=UPI0031DED0A9